MSRLLLKICVGLGLLLSASVQASALNYALQNVNASFCQPNCPSMIVATGTINGREAEEFAWFVRHNTGGRQVVRMMLLHSPGGNAYGGMTLGALLRQFGFTVVVAQASDGNVRSGICTSACVFALAGGKTRIVPGGSVVGVHGARLIQSEVHDRMTGTVEKRSVDQGAVIRMFGDFYARMGVSRDLARLGETVSSEQIRVLAPNELTRFKLARTKF